MTMKKQPMNHHQRNRNQHQIVNIFNLNIVYSEKKKLYLDETISSTNVPRWYFELRRWKHTYYSLSFDTDNNDENNNDDDGDDDQDKDGSLDVMIFFNYHSGDTKKQQYKENSFH